MSAQRAERKFARVLADEVGFYPFRGPAASLYAGAILFRRPLGVNPSYRFRRRKRSASRHQERQFLCLSLTDLCCSSGPVVLLREGRLAELREEVVEAIERNCLRSGDLDAQRLA